MLYTGVRVPTETGKPGKLKCSWKSHGTYKIDQKSWNFTNFVLKLYDSCMFFATTKKLIIHEESLHFLTFSAKRRKCEIWQQRWSWKIEKWSWKSHGKISLWEPCGVLWGYLIHVPQVSFIQSFEPFRFYGCACGSLWPGAVQFSPQRGHDPGRLPDLPEGEERGARGRPGMSLPQGLALHQVLMGPLMGGPQCRLSLFFKRSCPF